MVFGNQSPLNGQYMDCLGYQSYPNHNLTYEVSGPPSMLAAESLYETRRSAQPNAKKDDAGPGQREGLGCSDTGRQAVRGRRTK